LPELARQFECAPNRNPQWKGNFLEGPPCVFGARRRANRRLAVIDQVRLNAKIGN